MEHTMRRTKLALETLEDRSVPAASLSLDGLVFVGPQPQSPAPVEAVLDQVNWPAVQLPAVQANTFAKAEPPPPIEGDTAIGQNFANPDDPIAAMLGDQAKLPAVQLPPTTGWVKIDPQPEPPFADTIVPVNWLNSWDGDWLQDTWQASVTDSLHQNDLAPQQWFGADGSILIGML